MEENDLKFANYYIDCLLKAKGKAISPSYKKYENAYNVIQRLKRKGIIERDGSNFIISELYYDEIDNAGSYSEWLLRDETIFKPNNPIQINVSAEPVNSPDKNSSLKKFFSSPWTIGVALLIIAEIKFRTIINFISGLF